MAVEYVSVEEAAKRLGLSKEAFRTCMKQNAFPMYIGMVWKENCSRKSNYKIFRKPFEKMMEEIGEKK